MYLAWHNLRTSTRNVFMVFNSILKKGYLIKNFAMDPVILIWQNFILLLLKIFCSSTGRQNIIFSLRSPPSGIVNTQ